MFMRYISHEIRTPLNTVFLGLKLLNEELQEKTENSDCVGILRDIQQSCFTAIEILNDMLTFDKVKSGLLTLEKKMIFPVNFIESTMTPFALQVNDISSHVVLLRQLLLL
jgi:signal transduction histidine kinase